MLRILTSAVLLVAMSLVTAPLLASPKDMPTRPDVATGGAVAVNYPVLAQWLIVYAVRHQYAADHHNTATLFQTGEINTRKFHGGSAIRAIDFRNAGRIRTLLDVPEGVVRDLEVSFDGHRILFAMRRDTEDDYHIYQMDADGGRLRQLTFGAGVSDIESPGFQLVSETELKQQAKYDALQDAGQGQT